MKLLDVHAVEWAEDITINPQSIKVMSHGEDPSNTMIHFSIAEGITIAGPLSVNRKRWEDCLNAHDTDA